jgi:hypothetical protein
MPQGKGMQIFAPALSAYQSSVVVVFRKELLERCGIVKIIINNA